MTTKRQSLKNNPFLLIRRNLLVMIANELLGMTETDIAFVFGTTKQNIHKILSGKGKIKELSPEIEGLLK